MIVISVPTDKICDKDGNTTPSWGNYFEQNTQQQQQSLSNEGFWIPSQSGTNLTEIAASLGQQTGANVGTIIFDPTVVNGGSSMAPNGQLKVLLADGNWHTITNS